MTQKRKSRITALLKSIETGDEASIAVVNPDKYIQHNPQTHEGGEGLAVLFKRIAKTSPRVDMVRIFSDGDYVFGHTQYFFDTARVGFEIFRFEGDQTVEHWDNIQPRKGPNPAGHSMVEGPTEATDLDRTEVNRELVRSFVEEVLVDNQLDRLAHYLDESFIDHSPASNDGLSALRSILSRVTVKGDLSINYQKLHRILAEGNFVLCVCEGQLDGIHSSFFDLFRIDKGKLVEHWDTTEAIPPRSEWKNDNGKF